MATAQPISGPYASPTSLLDHTLRTAPLKVVYSTLTFTALGGVVGAASGVARGVEAIPASFKTSLNTGIFSFTFFSIREYGLIPLLTHLDLVPSPLVAPSPATPPPSPHFHNFVPTLTSGIISGTLFSYFQRPAASIATHAKGGLTLGLGCLVVQSLVNEGDLARIKLLQRSEERQGRAHEMGSTPLLPTALQSDSPPLPTNRPSLLSPLPPNAPSNAQHFSDPTSLTFSERSDLLFKNLWTRTKETVNSWAPLKKLETGEYEQRLEESKRIKREELEAIRTEIRELEKVENERR
ncbi:hypothetical protein JCM11491_001184 [Sporobolomyces phaffii]